jgi:hypothetical protein
MSWKPTPAQAASLARLHSGEVYRAGAWTDERVTVIAWRQARDGVNAGCCRAIAGSAVAQLFRVHRDGSVVAI